MVNGRMDKELRQASENFVHRDVGTLWKKTGPRASAALET